MPSPPTSDAPTPVRLSERASRPAAIAAFVVVVIALGAVRLALALDLAGPVEAAVILVATFAPLATAVAVTAATVGRTGLRDLRDRATHWRIRPAWYILGVLVPVMVYGAVLALHVALGGSPPVFEAAIGLLIAEVIVVGLVLFLVEEIGWRGWLQRALQARTGAVVAALVIGVVWLAWHVPLFLVPDSPQSELSLPVFSVLVVAAAVVFAWVFNATGGSVLAVVAVHIGFNLGYGPTAVSLPDGANTFISLCAAATAVAALTIVFLTRGRLGLPANDAL